MAILAAMRRGSAEKSAAVAGFDASAAVWAELAALRARVEQLEAAARPAVGGPLSLADLARELGVSRWTVRRALPELRRCGLVEVMPVARVRRFDRASFERVRLQWTR